MKMYHLTLHLSGISQLGRMPRDYPLASLLHAEYFLLEIRTTARETNMDLWAKDTGIKSSKLGLWRMKTLLRTKKDGLLSEATYLFVFSFGNVGGKATILWLPALRGKQTVFRKLSPQELHSLSESLIPCSLTLGALGAESYPTWT